MDSKQRRLLSINLLMQLAASDPTPMGTDNLFFGARIQFPSAVETRDVESVLHDLTDAGHAREMPQALVKELKFYRITTDGRAYLVEAGFRVSQG